MSLQSRIWESKIRNLPETILNEVAYRAVYRAAFDKDEILSLLAKEIEGWEHKQEKETLQRLYDALKKDDIRTAQKIGRNELGVMFGDRFKSDKLINFMDNNRIM